MFCKLNFLLLLFLLVNIKISTTNAEEGKCFECKSKNECTQDLNTKYLAVCKKKKCYVRIDENGKTDRGCGECDEKELKDNKCQETDYENNGIPFPDQRPKCPQCTNCEIVNSNDNKYCHIYKDNVGCCIGTDEKSIIIRGCESDDNKEKIECKPCKDKECEKDIILKKTKCIKCTDAKACKRPDDLSGGKCSVKVTETIDCTENNDGNTCFTYRGIDNTVQRGCATKPPELNNGQLDFCAGDQCNSECVPDINCAQCTEEENSDCKNNKEEWFKKKCEHFTTVCYACPKDKKLVRGCGKTDLPESDCKYTYKDESPTPTNEFSCYRCRSDNPNQQFCADDKIEDKSLKPKPCTNKPNNDEKKCYIDNYDGIVIRGCISDILQSEVRDRCSVDGKGKYCILCEEANCNSGKVPNSSSYARISYGIIITLCLIVYLL